MEVVHCCHPWAAGAAEGEERCRLLQVAWVAAEAAVVRLNLPEHGKGAEEAGEERPMRPHLNEVVVEVVARMMQRQSTQWQHGGTSVLEAVEEPCVCCWEREAVPSLPWEPLEVQVWQQRLDHLACLRSL